jgi:type IV secretory pathway TraG/TraD family ATPase VirD4
MMDEGRSFIINLGNVGDPETRKLLGAFLMVAIEQAALSRSDLLPSQRRPMTLLVDEWPSFAAQEKTISHILSQTRKFNLRLYLAAQSLAQVDSARLTGALENCKLQIAFGLGRDSAETQARHIGDIDPLLIKEEQFTETQHNVFHSVSEQFETWTHELQHLRPQQAYMRVEGRPAMRVRTSRVREPRVSAAALSEVLTAYKGLYQRTREDVSEAMLMRDSSLRQTKTAAFDTGLGPAAPFAWPDRDPQ